jgi:nucleoid DNA-binding protein
VTLLLGIGVATVPGTATAANKAELIEAMASESGLSKADSKRALDAFTDATTEALKEGDRVALVDFGSFDVSMRARRGRGNGPPGESPVSFDPCPAFADALDLTPGNGEEGRAASGARCRDADVVVDAERIARDTRRGPERGLSTADAKRAIDAFVTATAAALNDDETVSLGGFGSFSISKRSARTGRNPQRGKEIKIPAKNVVKFKAGAELSKSVNYRSV